MSLGPDQARLYAIMSGSARDPAARLWRTALSAARPAYRAGLFVDQTLKARRAVGLGRPTVSVGNLTAGGTGKTPMVAALVERLVQLGHRPAVLMRGHTPGSTPDGSASDEAALLADLLPSDTPVEPDPSRSAAAQRVLERDPKVSCFVLDDGFQHRQVKRDLDLVLIDATRPFGFDRLLPRGLLREPVSALRRADAVIVTRADQIDPEPLDRLGRRIAEHHGRPPIAHATHAWSSLRLAQEHRPITELADHDVFGVAGIGNPAAFSRQLESAARSVVGFKTFDDHHAYTAADVHAAFLAAHRAKATAVVATEKDWVKWAPHVTAHADAWRADPGLLLPLYRPVVAMAFTMGEDALVARLRDALPLP
ncbi:MAG: tetraacyldisaccharide 4'-kinase [Planctomycetota bacterium]